ncbi:hypothetical protein J2Z40_000316 [Cytobacillus eiseniae]|uniref:Uncharacterized protein n=1 Tax=Cytobacillus eiseniae TaxID=762947 RepID=A0ABS4RA35_9BACI|nr:hypothetical protein [Cytobacillus eiseniae]MBP2239763.1 hypothetical protein [Cytobacillus eiseniae]
MAKKQLVELVNRLKQAGINVSFTKPRSKMIITLPQSKRLTTTTN